MTLRRLLLATIVIPTFALAACDGSTTADNAESAEATTNVSEATIELDAEESPAEPEDPQPTLGNNAAEEQAPAPAAFAPSIPEPEYTPEPAPAPAPAPQAASIYGASSGISFSNCSEARAAGYAPIYQGNPGYSTKLDRDRDGIACE